MRFLLILSFLTACLPSGLAQKSKNLKEALKAPEQVKHLVLRKDHLKNVPAEIAFFKNLEILDLGKNDIDSLPDFIRDLVHLKEIDLSNNSFKNIPRILSQLDSLKVIHLAKNPIHQIPSYIKDFRNINHLDLWHCNIEFIDPAIGELKQLKILDLRATYLPTKDLLWIAELLPHLKLETTDGCDCDK